MLTERNKYPTDERKFVTEEEFRKRITSVLLFENDFKQVDYVTGPGRSGAVAAVYASYLLGKPYLPYGQIPEKYNTVLIVDTVISTGRNMREATELYQGKVDRIIPITMFEEPPFTVFWFEEYVVHYPSKRILQRTG